MSLAKASEGPLERLGGTAGAQRLSGEALRLVRLSRRRIPPSRESYARTRRALDLPLEGDYGPEGVRQIRHEAGVAVATAKRKHASSAALALIDFLAEPCPDTARERESSSAGWRPGDTNSRRG